MNPIATEYTNSPERFTEIQKKIIIRSAVFVPLMMIFAFVVFVYPDDNVNVGWEVPIFYLLFIFAILLFSIFRTIKRQKSIYNSYKLTVTESSLLREQNNLPPVTIAFNEITQINEDRYGNLIIKGVQPQQIIVISIYTENVDQLMRTLPSVHPISEPKTPNILQKYPAILSVLAIGSMLTLYISTNRFIAATGGIICLALMIWSFYKIRTAPVIDKKLSRSSWWILVVILSIAATTYFKLFPIN